MSYVLTNYTMQCTDQNSGQVGSFLFDLDLYAKTGKFFALSAVYKDLDELFKNTQSLECKPCYVEHVLEEAAL